jgi:ferrochelatase
MRYGHPSIENSMNSLRSKGCGKILIFQLYPQYSATTTASVFDKVADAMRKLRWQPTLRYVPRFYNDFRYVDALATRTKKHMDSLDWQPEKIIVSYHGLPKDYIEKGDPYYNHCIETTRLLREKMGENEDRMITTFQSRVGRKQWVQPYTDVTIAKLAANGTKNIMLISPAFISDCVETLEELSIGLAKEFSSAGGKNFSVAPCLNESEVSINLLEAITKNELKGWI